MTHDFLKEAAKANADHPRAHVRFAARQAIERHDPEAAGGIEWERPANPPIEVPPWRKRLATWWSAVTGPDVDDPEYDRRWAGCRPCDWRHEDDKGNSYCRRCGCGQWWMARLDRKLRHANLECPDEPPRW